MSGGLATELRSIQLMMEEHFDPGQGVQVALGLESDLTQEQVDDICLSLRHNGLPDAHTAFGEGVDWDRTLLVWFARPKHGAKVLLPAIFIAALATAGVYACIGVRLGSHAAARR